MQQTMATEVSDVPVLEYYNRVQEPSRKVTEQNIAREYKNLLMPQPRRLTEDNAGLVTGKIISYPKAIQSVNDISKKSKNYVEGVVTSHDEISVKCDLIVNEKNISIQLPRSLFPQKIFYGLPINLEIINESGFRKPLITIREINQKNNKKIAEEFDLILGEL